MKTECGQRSGTGNSDEFVLKTEECALDNKDYQVLKLLMRKYTGTSSP